jgi:hypothetical protein
MVGKHLILDDDYYQRRMFCFGGDGGGGGGGGGGSDPNRGTERGRTNQPPAQAGPANPSPRPQRQQDFNDDRASRGAPTPSERNQNFGVTPRQVTTVAPAANPLDLVNQSATQAMARQQPMTDRQMLAASAGAPDPFAAPSGGSEMTAGLSPDAAGLSPQELANQLVRDSAFMSQAQSLMGNKPSPNIINSVQGAAGRRDAESGFFADAYDELYGGNAPGTAVGSILSGGILGNLANAPDAADAAAFNVGQLMSLGGVRDPETGLVSGAKAGPGTLSMNALGGVVYSGMNDPNYSGPFESLVRGTAGNNGAGDDRQSNNQMAAQQPDAPIDPGTTTPEQIDDLAVNYLQNPYYLYSGQNNLFQPYGYAGGTLVDLLQTRNMQMPGQAAPDLGLFGNPRDFS